MTRRGRSRIDRPVDPARRRDRDRLRPDRVDDRAQGRIVDTSRDVRSVSSDSSEARRLLISLVQTASRMSNVGGDAIPAATSTARSSAIRPLALSSISPMVSWFRSGELLRTTPGRSTSLEDDTTAPIVRATPTRSRSARVGPGSASSATVRRPPAPSPYHHGMPFCLNDRGRRAHALSLNVTNLFDRDPPDAILASDARQSGGFDVQQSSPLGRLITTGVGLRFQPLVSPPRPAGAPGCRRPCRRGPAPPPAGAGR
ncbi:hypothetical protein SAMN06297144_0587 [Sphingomonas guangdongensis]|uniref:Uncharacterized protein n=1 Tax=Sphingomonas guangdongensis TaxID=1141890 RepID=A0A285QHE8_9SPHN|nr:hypothetical protein SAMN06297144_0587 [Sphingomonas guangdongensis]